MDFRGMQPAKSVCRAGSLTLCVHLSQCSRQRARAALQIA